jgi:FixJ family two-component response regulator
MPPRHPLVVVVEDNADMNRAMDSMLQAAGFETAMFFSAEALLKAGVRADTACLVLDVHLPGMTGFELYDSLAAIHPPPPVIFMTAYDEPAARAQSKEAGAVAYLTKPFPGKRLIETIDRVNRSTRIKNGKT